MSDKELEIFALCERLTELLGDKEAIADLKKLYDRHPEMFKDMQEVSQTIKEVVSEPEIIRENPKAKNDKDFMLYKQLDNKKMADVGIKNDEGTNIIFHANKKNISKSSYFKKNKQMLVETPSAKAAPTRLSHCADKSSDLSRDSKVLSTSADNIIPQTQENKSIAEQIKAESKDFDTLSTNERLALLEKNQQAIAGMRMQSTKDLQQQNKDSMSIKQETESKDSKNQESQIRIRKNRR